MTPVFLLFMNKCVNQLDIYIDESGNFDDFGKHNLIYSVSFVMVDSADIEINNKQINLFQTKISKIVGGITLFMLEILLDMKNHIKKQDLRKGKICFTSYFY